MHGFNEIWLFCYTQLYNIASTYYCKTYFIGLPSAEAHELHPDSWCIYIFLLLFYFILVEWLHWSPFIVSRNLDDIFTYNHMALMSIRSRYHVKASIVLTRADNVLIHNYIRSLLNIMLRPILMVRTRLEPSSYCLCVWRLIQLSHTGSFLIYIYIYIYIQ